MTPAIVIVVPWAGAVALALLDGRRRAVAWTALGVLAVTLAATGLLAARVLREGVVETVTGGWPAGVGIALRADALGVIFALTSLAALVAALAYEVLVGVHERPFPSLVLFLAGALAGLFLTGDAFSFYVFFEVSMAASFVLATYGRREREVRAALIFTVINLVGSVMFLAAIAALYHVAGTLDMRLLAERLREHDPGAVLLTAVIVFVAFSLKLGLFPFHFWLPPIYRDAWPAIVAILAGAVANIGGYGLLRFGGDVLAPQLRLAAPGLFVLGGLSILYGGHQAVSVRTTSEALAYSAIGQAGYVLLALGVGGPLGLAAATLYAVVNAANKTLLFLTAGLRGRLAATAFAVGALSVAGVPPAAGFFGKAALFRAGVGVESVWLVALVVAGSGLSFVYMFQAQQRQYWARPAKTQRGGRAAEVFVLLLAVLVLGLGLAPQALLAMSERAASAVLVARGSP